MDGSYFDISFEVFTLNDLRSVPKVRGGSNFRLPFKREDLESASAHFFQISKILSKGRGTKNFRLSFQKFTLNLWVHAWIYSIWKN